MCMFMHIYMYAATAAKSLQSCLTLSHPIDGSPPGSPVPGILQARTLEWVAISFSNAWKWKNKVKSLSCVPLLATPWTAAYQAPPSMGFSKQEYWSGVPLPSLIHWKDWCWSWNSNTLATCCKKLTHLKRPCYWERLRAVGEGDDRGWDGWMASLTRWTWVWVNSGSGWWTGRPGMLQSMGLQRVGDNWVTELNWRNPRREIQEY